MIKAMFAAAPANPVLRVGQRRIRGAATDSAGVGYAFDVQDLAADTRYELRLFDGDKALSDPWPLSTFPAPDAQPDHTRLLVFTCAGGHPLLSEGENSSFLPMTTRRRCLTAASHFSRTQ